MHVLDCGLGQLQVDCAALFPVKGSLISSSVYLGECTEHERLVVGMGREAAAEEAKKFVSGGAGARGPFQSRDRGLGWHAVQMRPVGSSGPPGRRWPIPSVLLVCPANLYRQVIRIQGPTVSSIQLSTSGRNDMPSPVGASTYKRLTLLCTSLSAICLIEDLSSLRRLISERQKTWTSSHAGPEATHLSLISANLKRAFFARASCTA